MRRFTIIAYMANVSVYVHRLPKAQRLHLLNLSSPPHMFVQFRSVVLTVFVVVFVVFIMLVIVFARRCPSRRPPRSRSSRVRRQMRLPCHIRCRRCRRLPRCLMGRFDEGFRLHHVVNFVCSSAIVVQPNFRIHSSFCTDFELSRHRHRLLLRISRRAQRPLSETVDGRNFASAKTFRAHNSNGYKHLRSPSPPLFNVEVAAYTGGGPHGKYFASQH